MLTLVQPLRQLQRVKERLHEQSRNLQGKAGGRFDEGNKTDEAEVDTRSAGSSADNKPAAAAAVVACIVENAGPSTGIDTEQKGHHRLQEDLYQEGDTCLGAFEAVACQDSLDTSGVLLWGADLTRFVHAAFLECPGTEKIVRSVPFALTMYLLTLGADQTSSGMALYTRP